MERQGEDELGCAKLQERLREWQNQVRDTVATAILASTGTSGCVPSCWKASSLGFINKELHSYHLSLSPSAPGRLNLPQSVTVQQCSRKEPALVLKLFSEGTSKPQLGSELCIWKPRTNIHPGALSGSNFVVHISSHFIQPCSDGCVWNQSRKTSRNAGICFVWKSCCFW